MNQNQQFTPKLSQFKTHISKIIKNIYKIIIPIHTPLENMSSEHSDNAYNKVTKDFIKKAKANSIYRKFVKCITSDNDNEEHHNEISNQHNKEVYKINEMYLQLDTQLINDISETSNNLIESTLAGKHTYVNDIPNHYEYIT